MSPTARTGLMAAGIVVVLFLAGALVVAIGMSTRKKPSTDAHARHSAPVPTREANTRSAKPIDVPYFPEPIELKPLPQTSEGIGTDWEPIPDPPPRPPIPTGSSPKPPPPTSQADRSEDEPSPEAIARATTLAKQLRGPRAVDRMAAADALAELGRKGVSATRALCQATLDVDSRVRVKAVEALEKVNPPIHRNVVPILVDPLPQKRGNAVTALGLMGADAKPAIPILLAVKPTIGPSAELIVGALAQIAPDDPKITNLMCGWAVRDQDERVRRAAAQALPAQEGYTKERVRALMDALRADPSGSVRLAAANGLGKLGPAARGAEKALTAAKTDREEAVREAARTALEAIRGE